MTNKKKRYGIIDIEDYYSEEQVLSILKEEINIENMANLNSLPSKSVRDHAIYIMSKELCLTPKTIQKMTNIDVVNIRRIIREYEKCLIWATCVPNEKNSFVGDCPQ